MTRPAFSPTSSTSSLSPRRHTHPQATRLFIHFITIIAICTLFLTDGMRAQIPPPDPIVRGQNLPRRGASSPTIAQLILHLVTTHTLATILDYPCRAHRDITPPLFRALSDAHASPHYICIDASSAHLAATHATLSRQLPASYVRLDLFRPAPNAASRPKGQLLLAWRAHGNDTRHLRVALRAAELSAVRFAILGVVLPPHAPFVAPDVPIADIGRVPLDLPLDVPFSHALVWASDAFDERRVLLVYDVARVRESRARDGAGRDAQDGRIGGRA